MSNKHEYYVEPWLIYNAQQVKQQLLDRPGEFAKEIEELRKEVKQATGHKWDNDYHHMATQSRSHLLVFQMNTHRELYSFHVWDRNARSIGGGRVEQGRTDAWRELVEDVFARIDEYDQGMIHCSDCQKAVLKSDIAGRYFAGVYCIDCWERKWRAIEAEETYN